MDVGSMICAVGCEMDSLLDQLKGSLQYGVAVDKRKSILSDLEILSRARSALWEYYSHEKPSTTGVEA